MPPAVSVLMRAHVVGERAAHAVSLIAIYPSGALLTFIVATEDWRTRIHAISPAVWAPSVAAYLLGASGIVRAVHRRAAISWVRSSKAQSLTATPGGVDPPRSLIRRIRRQVSATEVVCPRCHGVGYDGVVGGGVEYLPVTELVAWDGPKETMGSVQAIQVGTQAVATPTTPHLCALCAGRKRIGHLDAPAGDLWMRRHLPALFE